MLERVTADSPQRWREDLLKIKGLGFNTVRTWVDWNTANPQEGVYTLDNLDLLFRLAEEVGLKVIIQMYVDSAPDWVGRKYPDSHFIAQNGTRIPVQSSPGYCFDHPGVRHAVLGFFQAVAKRAAASPAFHAFDLWSEPHVINWAELQDLVPNGGMFCYCPNSIARFRGWLQRKYADLHALNAAWYRSFHSWQDVEPPRFGTILTYADYMDWRIYTADKLAEDLKARSSSVKSVDPLLITTSHAAIPSTFTTLANGWGTPDDFLMKDSVDYYGTSFYPKLTSPSTHWSLPRRALVMDSVRAVTGGRGFYVGELQAGFGVHGVIASEEIMAGELELWAWGMVSRGAHAINFYAFYPMSTGYESGGYGLINLDGSLTERSKRAGATAMKIAENSGLILRAQPAKAEAAIIFNPLTSLVGGFNFADRLAMRDALAGYHRMFFERNIPLDILSARDLSAERLRQYRLVILPYPIMMMAPQAAALESYVRDGGHLFTEARPGWVDEKGHGYHPPAFGWTDMLGVKESSITPRQEFRVRWGEAEFTASGFEERFEVTDAAARAIATFEDGTPAAYERQHGKGRAIILGAFAGQINERKPQEMHALGRQLVKWATLAEPELTSSSPIEVRQMDAQGGKLVFLLNHGKKPAQVQFATVLAGNAAEARELLTGEKLAVSGRQLQIKAEVPPESARVFRIDYK